jgi:hypothetical protein
MAACGADQDREVNTQSLEATSSVAGVPDTTSAPTTPTTEFAPIPNVGDPYPPGETYTRPSEMHFDFAQPFGFEPPFSTPAKEVADVTAEGLPFVPFLLADLGTPAAEFVRADGVVGVALHYDSAQYGRFIFEQAPVLDPATTDASPPADPDTVLVGGRYFGHSVYTSDTTSLTWMQGELNLHIFGAANEFHPKTAEEIADLVARP